MLGVAALLVAGCGNGMGGAEGNVNVPRQGGEVRVAGERDVTTLDPLYATTIEDDTVLAQMYDSLIGLNQRLEPVPELATSWRYQGPTSLVLTLRSGVLFQDGTPFDAQAVTYNLDRYRDTQDSPRREELSGISSVTVDGPRTVTLHLKSAEAPLLSYLAGPAGMMVSPTALAAAGDEGRFAASPIGGGTGPFAFYEYRPDGHLIMLANGRYWGKRPYIRQLTYTPIPNLHSQLDGLRNGFQNIQRTIARDDISAAQHDASVSISWQRGTEYTGIELNNAAAPFDDAARRRAVAGAMDRAAIVARVLGGYDTPAYGLIPPRSWAYGGTRPPATPTAASPVPAFSFTLKTDTLDQDMAIAEMIKSQLRSVGITVRVQPEDAADIAADLAAHRFDAALVDLAGGADPDQDMYAQFHTGGALNYGRYSNPAVDADLDNARTAPDGRAGRLGLYADAQRRILADAGFVPLTFPPIFNVHDWAVRGYSVRPDGVWNMKDVWIP